MLSEEAINYYYDHPHEFFQDILKTHPTKQQEEILNQVPIAIKSKKNISVKSGHGTGKTFVESGLIIWFLATRYKAKVVTTAPTQAQLFDVLWSELSKHNDNSLLRSQFEMTATRFNYKGSPKDWFAVARSATHPENMQGFHAENLLIIVDEASGVGDDILEAIEGACTEEGNIIMMFGNPTKLSGSFYDSFNTKVEFYHVMTMSCLDSSNVAEKYYKQIEAKYGADSDVYRVRVLGEFPETEDSTVISKADAELAAKNDEWTKIKDDKYVEEIGVDVARFGGDETSIYSREGNRILPIWISSNNDTMEIVGRLVNHIKNKTHKIRLNIDDTGVGGGVTDRLKELKREREIKFNVDINPVNNQSKARDKKSYANIGTELWYFMQDFIQIANIPKDNKLITQLSVRRYKFTSNGRLILESKEDMKKRKVSSPDRADAVILSCASLTVNDTLQTVNLFDKTPRSTKEQDRIKEEIETNLFKRLDFYKQQAKHKGRF